MDVLAGVAGAASLVMAAVVALLISRTVDLQRDRRSALTRLSRLERVLRESKEYYQILVEASPDAIVIVGLDGQVVRSNEQGARLLGVPTAEHMAGCNIFDWFAAEDREVAMDMWRSAGETTGPVPGVAEFVLRRGLGEEFVAEVSSALLVDGQGDPAAFTVVLRDITERRAFEDRLRHQALHDVLTGLPNRSLLYDRLSHAIKTARRQGDHVSLLLLDLDGFKEINDSFGHHCGDLLLTTIGARLREAVRESDTVARLGGDEFAIVLPGTDGAGARVVASQISGALDAPVELEDHRFTVAASIGVAVFPVNGNDGEALLRLADTAMYAAKRGRQGVVVYDPAVDARNVNRLSLATDLRFAVQQRQLMIHFQPKVQCATGVALQLEVLVRWQHPERGFVSPEEFVRVAEQTGLIQALTAQVLGDALRQCRRWREEGLDACVAVNISPDTLQGDDLMRLLPALLADCGADPAWLTIELTETSVMADPERAIDVLSRLRRMGMRIAVDDFGTGYSSLAYLARLPVDELKIDRSFVMDMAKNEHNAAIVRSVVELGHSLGMQVVAEGVEDVRTYEQLCAMGVDYAQGYYIARPASAENVGLWLWGPGRGMSKGA